MKVLKGIIFLSFAFALVAPGQQPDGNPYTFTMVGGAGTITKYECPVDPHPVYVPSAIQDVPVNIIGGGAFAGCESILGVLVPEPVYEIGNSAFWNCRNLQVLELPTGLKRIGIMAFYGCLLLEEVTIPAGVEFISDHAFAGCEALKKIKVHPENVRFADIGGLLVSKDTKLLIQFPGGMGADFDVPETITEIGAHAFADGNKLKTISIPGSVISIGEHAFANCIALTSVTLAEGLEKIGAKSFSGCRRLTKIVIPASVKQVDNEAFEDCTSLREIHFLGPPPVAGENVFKGLPPSAVVVYQSSAAGWSDSWAGLPTKPAP